MKLKFPESHTVHRRINRKVNVSCLVEPLTPELTPTQCDENKIRVREKEVSRIYAVILVSRFFRDH